AGGRPEAAVLRQPAAVAGRRALEARLPVRAQRLRGCARQLQVRPWAAGWRWADPDRGGRRPVGLLPRREIAPGAGQGAARGSLPVGKDSALAHCGLLRRGGGARRLAREERAQICLSIGPSCAELQEDSSKG